MEGKIHVSRNQDSLGVFTEAQLKVAIDRGSVYESDFCWTAGMKAWSTIGQSYPHLLPTPNVRGQTSPPAYPPAMRPAASTPQAAATPALPPRSPHPQFPAQTQPYPSAGDRFLACLLDGIFLMVLFCGCLVPTIGFVALLADGNNRSVAREMESVGQFLGFCISLVVGSAYYGLLGNSVHHATWGQRILGFKMADSRTGGPPRSEQVWKWALLRSLLTSCCGCIGLLFFIPILSDPRKQSAYDSWADIVMVRK